MITSEEGGGDGSGGTQVNGGVEVHEDPLVGQGGADDDGFSGFQDSLLELASVLLGHQGGDVGFDSTGTDAHDEDGDDQATKRSIRVLKSRRSGGASEDHVSSPGRGFDVSYGSTRGIRDSNVQVNQRENQDGVVTAQPTVSDDSTEEGRGVNPESVESADGKGLLLTHAKSPGDALGAVRLRDGPGGRTRGQLGTNIVVVDVGGSYRRREGGDVSHKTRS